MALGEIKMFQFKSKEQLERESAEYAVWAFPHGELQRENLITLVKELFSKPYIPLHLTSFLTCKEMYEKALKDASQDDAIMYMLNSSRRHSQLIKPADMPMYLALVLADATLDESCQYPSADEIRTKTQELIDMCGATKKKGFFKRK